MIKDYAVNNLTEEEKRRITEIDMPELVAIGTRFGMTVDEIKASIRLITEQKTIEAEFETFNDNSRGELREQIIDDYINNFKSGVCENKAIILLGPPAAGKSTMVDHLLAKVQATVLDADIIKTGMGDFQGLKIDFKNGAGEDKIYKEVAFIINKVFDRLLQMGENLIIPKVGADKKQIEGIVDKLKNNGYTIDMYLINLPTYQSSLRNISRFLQGLQDKNARFVDTSFIINTDNGPFNTFCSFLVENEQGQKVEKFRAFSNDVPFGTPPEEIDVSRLVAKEVVHLC